MTFLRQSLHSLATLTAIAALCACGGDGGADATKPAAADGAASTATPAPGSAAAGTTGTSTAGAATGPAAASGASGNTESSAAGGAGATGTGTAGAATAGSTADPQGAGPATPAANVIASSGTLQTGAVPAAYASGSLGGGAFNALNVARQAAGAGLLKQSTQLDLAAAAHAKYLVSNIGATGHGEEAGKIDFYAVSPPNRMAKAGFAAGYWTEVVGRAGTLLLGSDCVRQLLNSVYHAVALLSPATHVGFGFGSNFATTPLCVGDLATVSGDLYGQVGAAGALLTYPYDGQAGVADDFDVNAESPRLPVDLFPNASAGTPVIVSVRNADYVNLLAAGTLNAVVTKFELRDLGGNRVPVQILADPSLHGGSAVMLNADSNLPGGVVVMVPNAPLVRGQNYTVSFAATLKAAGPMLEKTWSFDTRP